MVLSEAGRDKHGNRLVLAMCDCGTNGTFVLSRLRSGETQSCGCLHRERLKEHSKTHGLTGQPTYITWQAMKRRCSSPKSIGWHLYGGRGIKVCERWQNFENFLADMGERPPGATLDRINSNGDYEPGNCRWLSRKEQNRNRRDNVRFKFQGMMRTIPEIAEMVGLKEATLRRRLRIRGESLETTIRPVRA